MLKTTVTKINLSGRICNQLQFNVSNNPLSVQSVRWRKPLWLGTAKSKLFRVPPRRKQDPEERAELFRLSSNYKTLMRSIKEHFKQENELREQKEASVQVSVEDDEDFKKIETLNDAWNAEIAKLREVRVKKEKEKREVYILSRLDAKKEREEKLRQHANELVRKEMDACKTYIYPEKLDAAIEYALTHPIDFNYAIDAKGNIYAGRTSNANEAPKDKELLSQ